MSSSFGIPSVTESNAEEDTRMSLAGLMETLMGKVEIDWSTVPTGKPITALTAELLAVPCWRWTGLTESRTGLGRIKVNGKKLYVRRVMYETFVGEIPTGKVLGQRCANKWCVNFAHLEPRTIWESLMAGPTVAARNAAITHCPQGHEYDEENTAYRPAGHAVARECKTCNRARTKARRKVAA
jgi:hypothetical protein